MGCTASRLEDEEAVQLCKDRRNFIKQAVKQRIHFASSHIAYIQSLKRVSSAIQDYFDSDWQHDLFSETYTTPPFTPVKRLSSEFISIPIKPPISASSQPGKSTLHISKYLSSSGNQSVIIEEWPRSPETVRVESYHSTDHYGIDGYFAAQASPVEPSFVSPYNRPSFQTAFPQNSQWNSFWNPFSSLDTYGYTYRNGYNEIIDDDDIASLRQVREEEGIPELEEEDNDDVGIKEGEEFLEINFNNERPKADLDHNRARAEGEGSTEAKVKPNVQQELKEIKSKGVASVEVSEAQNTVKLEVINKEELQKIEKAEETPGFTAYLNPSPTSMTEIIKVIENEFARICDYAHEVSVMLEASHAQYSSTSTEIIAVKILNPVALFRSASSRSTSSRFFLDSSSSRDDDGYDSSSEYSDDSCMISGSHQCTLDRLYAWEKKLYQEVKAWERTRIAFEKKCMLLKNQDANGEDHSSVEKTRRALRDLNTRLKVSMHSVQSVSKRIETLRDEELQPQLMELLQGLARMWKATADSNQVQKRAVDEAKLFLVSSSKNPAEQQGLAPPQMLRSAAVLEAELRNWRSCLGVWLAAQRAYAHALAGWILRCGDPDPGAAARSLLSPRRSSGGVAAAVLGICVQWSRMLDFVSEAQVLDGLDFFVEGMASVSGAEAGVAGSELEEPAVTSELAGRVLWAGMSVALSSLSDFAARSAEGYDLLVKRDPPDEGSGGTGG